MASITPQRNRTTSMLGYSIPPGYRRKEPATRPKLGPWVEPTAVIVEHRRDVLSGDLWACTASGFSRGQKSTVGSAGVWTGAGDGTQDVGVFDSAGLPGEKGGDRAQTGAVGRRDRRHPRRRQDQTSQAAT